METPRQANAGIDDLLRDIKQRESSVLNELWKLIVARQARRPEESALSHPSRDHVTTSTHPHQASDSIESP